MIELCSIQEILSITLVGRGGSAGNPTHSFAAEYSMLRNMAKENMVRLCGVSGCYGKPAPQQG